jgi:hypothetical protein
MKVLVFRNRFGAAAAWLLPDTSSDDAPDMAVLPGPYSNDPRIQNMATKGSAQSWQDWAAYLASQPLLGNWAVQELPDGLDADEALAWVRRDDTEKAATGA